MKTRTGLAWSVIGALAVLLLALLWMAPLLCAAGTALRSGHGTVAALFHRLPWNWTPGAFAEVLGEGQAGGWMLSSALAALMVTIATMALALTAAYAFLQLRLRGRSMLSGLGLLVFLAPFAALLVPLFRIMNQPGLTSSYAGVILPQVVAPLVIYVFKQCFDAVPADLREAAVMDGARPLRILWNVYLPVSGNIVWAMSIVTFIAAWNNFLWPFIIVSQSDMMTIPHGLANAYDAHGVIYAQLMAGALVGALPVALAYVLLQRRATRVFLAAAGLKG